ncbi:MAG TPA: hypothetical protein VN817_06425 [Solirubrobacteraceae bacterium]|nr:hypothetical protein [Solirubrobacteraceae bacterium]
MSRGAGRRASTGACAAALAMLLSFVALPAGALAVSSTAPATPAAPVTPAPVTPTPTPTPAEPAPSAACVSGAAVLANTAGAVAQRIYASEVSSSEVSSDKRQIESYAPLIQAVESNDRAALATAVHTLVYSHTHIVRLRVSVGSTLLFDEGGPYILAPVQGKLRSHGKEVGHFVFSVQDDLGYVKLETRFIGAPLVLRTESGQVPIEGLLTPGPPSIPDLGPVSYKGASYEAYSFDAAAYPSGRLRISLLLPVAGALARKTCDRIKAEEMGLVAQRISRRFTLSPSSFAPYVHLTQTLTHTLVYVRKGSQKLAGGGPAKLPSSGPLSYRGKKYEVTSFAAPASGGQVRVSVLVAL